MVRQAHHERNFFIAAHPELSRRTRPESILSGVEGRLGGAIFWLVFGLLGQLGQLHFAGEAVAQVRETKHVEAQKLPASQVTLPPSRLHGVRSDPSNSFKLYSSTEKGLVVSDNGGHSWQPIAIAGRHEEIFALTLHPVSPDTLYVGRRDGLWRSQDAGKSWDQLPYPESIPLSIAVARSQSGTLYLATSRRGVHKSIDGGYQWAEINQGLPEARAGGRPEEVHTLVVDSADSNIAYAGLPRHGIYRTTNGGRSWRAFNQNLPIALGQAISPPKLAIDPDDPERLYLALNQRIHSRLVWTRLYVLANGMEWLPVEAALPANLPIQDLLIDRTKRTLQLWGADAVWELPLPRNEKR